MRKLPTYGLCCIPQQVSTVDTGIAAAQQHLKSHCKQVTEEHVTSEGLLLVLDIGCIDDVWSNFS